MAIKISATKGDENSLNKNSSGLFLGVVFVLLLLGILALSLWVSELSKASEDINTKVETRLMVLEEQLKLADSTSTDFLSDINSQLQFLDKEIRKLWDLSNKRNKVNIANLDNEVKKHSNALKEIALIQTNDQKNINAIKEQSQKLKILLNQLNESNQENASMINKISELSNSILLMEETIQAFDVYRRQNNELLQEMQLQISSIESL
jgi:septal ring factor EnvC (AmiA/AmiB activator)